MDLVKGVSTLLAMPSAVWAQAPSTPDAATPDGTGAGLVAFAVPLVLLAAIVTAVKMYDARRRRDEDAMALEARISDALLVESALKGFPVVATVRMPLSRRAETVVELKGTVPTTGLREVAFQIAARECSIHGVHGRIEDRIVVDPLALERVA
jgi:hypothetical protein